MNKGYFHSAGTLPIVMFPDRFHVQRFVFTVDDLPWDITSFTWQLLIRSNKGNRENLLSLTLGNGLSFPIYETNALQARFETAQCKAIGEGEYFWMLVKTDTNEPILKGICTLDFDPEATGTDLDVTVAIINGTINVNIQSLLTGNSSGGSSGGGGSPLTNWPIANGMPTGTIPIGTRYYLTGPAGIILLEAVAEGTTMEARVANPVARGDWYFNFGGT